MARVELSSATAARRSRPCRFRARRSRSCRWRASTCRPPSADGQAARQARGGDPARRGQAGEPRVRRQGAARRRGGRTREARPPARRAGGAVSPAGRRDGRGATPPRHARPWSPAQAESYLRSMDLFGMRFGLDRMRRLMTVLGMPHERFASVHVVGTNGKSSTSRFIAAILARHGLRTGAYLSPHLISYTERVQIDERDVESRCVRRGRRPRRLGGRARQPDARRGRRRDAVRAADGGRIRAARRPRRRGGRDRGRARRALRRDERRRRAP